jgi:carbonic anhydrase
VQLVKSSPLVRKELADRTRGFVFDIKTGKVNAIE